MMGPEIILQAVCLFNEHQYVIARAPTYEHRRAIDISI